MKLQYSLTMETVVRAVSLSLSEDTLCNGSQYMPFVSIVTSSGIRRLSYMGWID